MKIKRGLIISGVASVLLGSLIAIENLYLEPVLTKWFVVGYVLGTWIGTFIVIGGVYLLVKLIIDKIKHRKQ